MSGRFERLVSGPASRLRTLRAVFRVMPAAQVALRVVLLVSGGASLVLAQGRWALPGGLAVLLGAAALLGTVLAPESPGAGMVVGAAVVAWVLRWGVHQHVPAVPTVLLAVLLYLCHTTAALLAVLPPVATVDRAVLVRWYLRALAVSASAVLLGAVALATGRVAGGILVDLLGLVGVVVLAGIPVLLAAGGRTGRADPDRP